METRLNKFLAECGICSRREADRLIEEGRVIVNKQVAKSGQKVESDAEVLVDNRKVERKHKKTVLAYYKPIGVTCTEKDSHAERTILEELKYPVRVTYAGRLDKDSEGLMIMTDDGDLIERMMRAAHCHEKEYEVRVDQEVTQEFLKKMAAGVFLEELDVKTRPCKVKLIGINSFRIILTQGLNRQIRRMCKTLGMNVTKIKRIRVMNVELGTLKPGEYRKVEGEELEQLIAETLQK